MVACQIWVTTSGNFRVIQLHEIHNSTIFHNPFNIELGLANFAAVIFWKYYETCRAFQY